MMETISNPHKPVARCVHYIEGGLSVLKSLCKMSSFHSQPHDDLREVVIVTGAPNGIPRVPGAVCKV